MIPIWISFGCLKLSATDMPDQQPIQAKNHENIKVRYYHPLEGKSLMAGGFPLQIVSLIVKIKCQNLADSMASADSLITLIAVRY